MNADDISKGNRIEKQRKFLKINNLDFVFSGVMIIDENSNESYETNKDELNPMKVNKLFQQQLLLQLVI
jgi:hypothetical protein